jgi:hypothetical protein
VCGRACRIAHIVQTIEAGNEVEFFAVIVFGQAHGEPRVLDDAMALGVRRGLADRTRMKIVADELGFRERLGHHDG